MAKKGRIQKKPYCNPKITKVNLRSEETVLTACKTDSQGSPYGAAYTACKYRGASCSDTGS